MDIESAKRLLKRYGISFGFDYNLKLLDLAIRTVGNATKYGNLIEIMDNKHANGFWKKGGEGYEETVSWLLHITSVLNDIMERMDKK